MKQGFTTTEVVRLSGVNGKTLHVWDRTGFLSPSILQAHGTGSRRVYSFQDLVAARVAGQLRRAGVSLQTLRKVVAWLRQERQLGHPLAETYLVTDGYDVYEKSGEELLSVLRRPGQQTFAFVLNLGTTVAQLQEEVRKLESA